MTTTFGRAMRAPERARWTVLIAMLATGGCAAATAGSGASSDARSNAVRSSDLPASPVERLLEASDISGVVDQRARVFSRQVAVLAADLTDEELERIVPAVQDGFAPDLLRRDVAEFIEAEAPPGRIDEVLDWMENGGNAEARRLMAEYDPPLSLQEWLGEYTDEPPTRERVQLIARWAEARGAGDFFVLLDEALAEAAFAVRGALRPGASAFQPMRTTELLGRLERSFNASVLTALHEGETVPDDVVRRATLELESEAGRWYVLTWQLAVAEAVRSAGQRVVATLES